MKKKAAPKSSTAAIVAPVVGRESIDKVGAKYLDFDVVAPVEESTVEMSADIGQLCKSLVAFEKDVAVVGKDTDGFNYEYLSLGGLLHVIGPIMAKHGLGLSQFPASGHWVMKWVNEGPRGDLVERYQAGVITIVFHSSGQFMKSKFVMPMPTLSGQINTAQETGAGITYARRYAICAALRIATEDTDAAE